MGPLAVPLYILIGQNRQNIIFNLDFGGSIKLISDLHDKCQDTMIQFVEFVHTYCTADGSLAKSVPPTNELVCKYHLEPQAAFLLTRPFLNPNGHYGAVSGEIPISFADAVDKLEEIAPPNTLNVLSKELYSSFWCLGLYDLSVPSEQYEAEAKKHKSEVQRLENELRHASDSQKRKLDKEKQKSLDMIKKLEEERSAHVKHTREVSKRIKLESAKWITQCDDHFPTIFLQACLLPRVVMTAPDALFCSKFMQLLHQNGVKNYFTLQLTAAMFSAIHGILFKCTEAEAGRLGRFLLAQLSLLQQWHSDEAVYKDQCESKPGFATQFNDPTSKRASYADYKQILGKWHHKLARTLVTSLESNEYLDKRNALLVLIKVVKVFPKIKVLAAAIEKRVKTMVETEDREDLKLLSKRYLASLTHEKASWLSNEDFGLKPVAGKRPKPAPAESAPAEKPAAEPKKEPKKEAKKESKKESKPSTPRESKESKPEPAERAKPARESKPADERSAKPSKQAEPAKRRREPEETTRKGRSRSPAAGADRRSADKEPSRGEERDRRKADESGSKESARGKEAAGGQRDEKAAAEEPPPSKRIRSERLGEREDSSRQRGGRRDDEHGSGASKRGREEEAPPRNRTGRARR